MERSRALPSVQILEEEAYHSHRSSPKCNPGQNKRKGGRLADVHSPGLGDMVASAEWILMSWCHPYCKHWTGNWNPFSCACLQMWLCVVVFFSPLNWLQANKWCCGEAQKPHKATCSPNPKAM